MSVWGWVQAIATGWFALSILLAVAWALGGKRIFRKPPEPPLLVDGEEGDAVLIFDRTNRKGRA